MWSSAEQHLKYLRKFIHEQFYLQFSTYAAATLSSFLLFRRYSRRCCRIHLDEKK